VHHQRHAHLIPTMEIERTRLRRRIHGQFKLCRIRRHVAYYCYICALTLWPEYAHKNSHQPYSCTHTNKDLEPELCTPTTIIIDELNQNDWMLCWFCFVFPPHYQEPGAFFFLATIQSSQRIPEVRDATTSTTAEPPPNTPTTRSN
jgi:hypothetical protein